jgi:hypothetical protein
MTQPTPFSNRSRATRALAWALVIALLLAPAESHSDEPRRIGHTRETGIHLGCTATPQWSPRPAPRSQNTRRPDRLVIYLDISEPMGGFLPVPNSTETSPFKTLVLSLPGKLVSATGQRVVWKKFGNYLSKPVEVRDLDRRLFRDDATHLDLAIADAIKDLSSGDVQTAVIVTDLVATGDVIGAPGAARPLIDWLASEPVQSGRFHLGLLGVRAPYWGAFGKTCRPAMPGLGCWFSERAPGYKPLSKRALIPFYFLIIGRDAPAIKRLQESLAKEATNKFATQWELLTAASQPLLSRLDCTAHEPGDEKGRQYALFRSPEGQVLCKRDEEVEMSCTFPSDAGITLTSASAPRAWPEVKARLKDSELTLAIDCERIRDRKVPTTDLDLVLGGVRGPANTRLWQGWSSDTDEEEASLGKTLDLDGFIERVRLTPDRWAIDCEPLFRGGGGHGP